VNQVPYEAPSDLEEAITGFVDHYNDRRYHKALGNVTPDDVLHGRREEILITREEVKAQTLAQRKRYDHLLRESQNTAISPRSLLYESVPLLLVANREFPHVYTEINLTALSDDDSEELFENLLGISDLPVRLRRMILQKTDGNPFFIEEFIRTHRQRGHRPRSDRRPLAGRN